jgi:membrane protein YdbS with pleckstrin-like domain
MSPQLHLVTEDGNGPEPLAFFRTDARLRLFAAGACAGVSIALTVAEYRHALPALVAGPLAAAFVLWAVYMLGTFAIRRAVRYRLTAQRLEVERGILGKRFESIDLWRVRDVVLDQSPLERMRGVGRITVISSDQLEPELLVGPVADAKALYDRLRDAVAAARKQARVVPLA